MDSKNTTQNKKIPKWFYYSYLGVFVIMIILLILNSKYFDECVADKCYPLIDEQIISFLVVIPITIISVLFIIFFVAKKYEFRTLILPILSIIPFLILISGFTGVGPSLLYWIYSILGICTSLFFIWRN